MNNTVVTFSNPPVVEVVAGVSFTDSRPEFGTMLSAFWKEVLRERFPGLQQQPPYTPPEEVFGDQPSMGGITFQFGGSFGSSRLWASSADGDELLQLQPEWFARNWRKVNAGDEYDRWSARRAAFSDSVNELDAYLNQVGMRLPAIRQCEVSYVNHISLEGVSGGHGGIGEVFEGQGKLSTALPVEQATIKAQYVLTRGSQSVGRLYANASPALDVAGKPIYVLELTARGKPVASDLDSALDFLDYGRTAINQAFVALTTPEMHSIWGKQNV